MRKESGMSGNWAPVIYAHLLQSGETRCRALLIGEQRSLGAIGKWSCDLILQPSNINMSGKLIILELSEKHAEVPPEIVSAFCQDIEFDTLYSVTLVRVVLNIQTTCSKVAKHRQRRIV